MTETDGSASGGKTLEGVTVLDLSPGDTVRFDGFHRFPEGRDRTDPRLVAVDDS